MESIEQCFEAVLAYCKTKVVETTYNVFLKNITILSLKNGVATLCVGSRFQRDVVSERYIPVLKEGFEHALGFPVDVDVVTSEDVAIPAENAVALGERTFTFDSFIVGSNNRFAYAAAQAVAQRPAQTNNPLFIYGSSGLGKTHLLLAIKNEIQKRFPGFKIAYVDGEEFTNELINAIQHSNTAQFHENYRTVDVLLVDDIQFIAGKVQTQEEFFHTFEALYKAAKQIVLTSDRPPKEIQALEERMRSRFESGLLADISAPDFETKVAILKSKADALNFELPDEVAKYIANHIKSNIRQLEGTVKKLNAYRLMDGVSPSIGLAENAIKDILSEQQPIPVTVNRIIEEVGRTYNISAEDLRSTKQDADISRARHIAMYIIREVTGLTLDKIGEEFSGRHYATVVYANKKVEDLIKKDHTVRLTIDDIIKNCKV